MSELSYVTEANFEQEVLQAELPVLVDFTAAWCGPCKMVDPIVHQLAEDWQGQVKVVKCDADQNSNLLIQYGILGIPTLIMFKQSALIERVSGYQPKDKLVARFSAHF